MDTVKGTINTILDDGKNGQNWSALLHDTDDNIVFIESHIPLDLNIGDSAEFFGKSTPRQKSIVDRDFLINTHDPKQFRENAFYKNKTMTILGSSNIVGLVSKNIQQNTPYKFIGLKLNQDDIEPDIKWGMDIFQKMDINAGTGIITILQPALAYQPNYTHKLNIIKKLLTESKTNKIRKTKEMESYFPLVIPKYLKSDFINSYHNMSPNYSYRHLHADNPLYQNMGVITPYNIKSSSFNQIMGFSSTNFNYNEFYPNKLPSLDAINKMTIAHELAHAYSHDYYGNVKKSIREENDLNRVEIFADVVSIMACLNNGVPEKDLQMIANARLMAFLTTSTLSYDTGLACLEAIKKGKELKEKNQGNVSIQEILLESSKITEKNHQNFPVVKNIFISQFKQHPNFIQLEKSKQIEVLDNCMDFVKKHSLSKYSDKEKQLYNKNLVLLDKHIMSIKKTLNNDFYNIHELLNNTDKMKRCMKLRNKSLNETIQNLQNKNLGYLIPDIINQEKQSIKKMRKSFIFNPVSRFRNRILNHNHSSIKLAPSNSLISRITSILFAPIKVAKSTLLNMSIVIHKDYETLRFILNSKNKGFIKEIKAHQKSINTTLNKNKTNIINSIKTYQTNSTPAIKLTSNTIQNHKDKPFDVFEQVKNIIKLYNERTYLLEQELQSKDGNFIYQANKKREELFGIIQKILFIPKNEKYLKDMFYGDQERLNKFIYSMFFSENIAGHNINDKIFKECTDFKIPDIDIFMRERQHSLFLYDKKYKTHSEKAQQYIIDNIEEVNKVQLKPDMILENIKLNIDIAYRQDFKDIILQDCDVTNIPNEVLQYCHIRDQNIIEPQEIKQFHIDNIESTKTEPTKEDVKPKVDF